LRSPKSTPHTAITEDILQDNCRCFRSVGHRPISLSTNSLIYSVPAYQWIG
jgi:hypothetical protein